jgi:predicted  nucleic acid-binding Zn-ribbon protein
VDAAPEVQLRLLDLQDIDAALTRLAARRRSLPEHAEIEQSTARLAQLSAELGDASTLAAQIGREQTRLEGEVEVIRGRAERDQKRLDAGAVSSSKELENLQSEIASLGRRQGALEDDLLEVMERAEEAQGRVSVLTLDRDETLRGRDEAVARRDAAVAAIDAEAAERRQAREAVAAELPAELTGLYDKIRASSGGVGAARLSRRRCEGCHLELAGTDLAELAAAPPQRVVRCEECRRILVRTPESGL